jgi:hypothetical protein
MGLVGMLALVLLVEARLRRHDRDLTTVWAAAWARAGERAGPEARGAEVLCLGDSLVMHGLAPRVIEQRLGRPSRSFALFKGQGPTAYFLLRRALDAGARPRAVLIDGELLGDDPLELTRLWPELLGLPELAELAWSAGDAGFFGASAMGRLVPSVRLRFEVREALLAAFRGEYASARWGLAPKLRNWRENLGAHIQSPASVPAEEVARVLEGQNYLPGGWACHPVNALYVERLLDLAGSRGVRVFWLLPPVQPEVQARRDRGGLSADYERFVRGLAERHANLVVLDGRHAGFPPAAMSDMTHLNRLGALAFSESVAEALGTRLEGAGPGDRWVALGPYREPPADLAVEDVDQSARALRQAGAERAGRRR